MAHIVEISKDHVVSPVSRRVRLKIRDDVVTAVVRTKKNVLQWRFKTQEDAEKAMIAFCNSRIPSARRIR